jgi:PleD family two-component response regulator
VRAKEIKHENSKVNKFLTISIGLVCCVADDALKEEVFISRADAMLYEAKDGGRDRYVMSTDISEAKTKKIEEKEKLTA